MILVTESEIGFLCTNGNLFSTVVVWSLAVLSLLSALKMWFSIPTDAILQAVSSSPEFIYCCFFLHS